MILIAFLIAVLVRASVGSSIVAMTMASGIMATMPAVMDTSMIYRAAMCCAICGGATALSHVNDAGFWLVSTFLEIDEKTTLKHLVQAASGCQKDVDLICGKYIVDAKSMLGVFSLPTFDDVELGVADDEERDLREKLESLNLIRE